MGRRRGYGQTNEAQQRVILRAVKGRKQLTNSALARRFNVSIEVIKGVAKRYRKALSSSIKHSEPTCQNVAASH